MPTNSVLVITPTHKTTCTRFGKHRPPPHWLWHKKMFTIWMTLVHVVVPNQTRHWAQGKVRGCKIQKPIALLLLLYTQHAPTNWILWLATNLYAHDALEGGYQHIMCGGLQTKWLGWHHMYLRVGWWASMYISNLKVECIFNYWESCYSFPWACW